MFSFGCYAPTRDQLLAGMIISEMTHNVSKPYSTQCWFKLRRCFVSIVCLSVVTFTISHWCVIIIMHNISFTYTVTILSFLELRISCLFQYKESLVSISAVYFRTLLSIVSICTVWCIRIVQSNNAVCRFVTRSIVFRIIVRLFRHLVDGSTCGLRSIVE